MTHLFTVARRSSSILWTSGSTNATASGRTSREIASSRGVRLAEENFLRIYRCMTTEICLFSHDIMIRKLKNHFGNSWISQLANYQSIFWFSLLNLLTLFWFFTDLGFMSVSMNKMKSYKCNSSKSKRLFTNLSSMNFFYDDGGMWVYVCLNIVSWIWNPFLSLVILQRESKTSKWK